jgi:hypothetical protein
MMSDRRFSRSQIEHLISGNFRIFQVPGRADGFAGKRNADLHRPQKMFGQWPLPLQIDRRGAIADRIGNVKNPPPR